MILDMTSYVPSLRWRQGEYQGLTTLTSAAKSKITPLITVPPIEFDFDEWQPKKTPHEFLFPFPVRLQKKWGSRPFWLDVNSTLRDAKMDDGTNSYDYLLAGVREQGGHAVPIVSFDMEVPILLRLKEHVRIDQQGIGLRVLLTDLMKPDFNRTVEAVLKKLNIERGDVDLHLDLEAPNYEPVPDFATALIVSIRRITELNAYRNFVLLGTSFPESMADLEKGESSVPRLHWKLYKTLIASMTTSVRRPNFGDYTIVHPSFVALDMRKVKPAGKIVYSTSEAFKVHKGGSFRDNREQMHDHCEAVVKRDYYLGETYSYGDKYIKDCASKTDGPSNLSQWKKVGINHHMTLVLDDLANLFGAT
jgi:hypothetical protein